jgi:hypothetical protein
LLSKSAWQAFYFDSLERGCAVVRTLIIEAEDEEEAGRIATGQMGRCMRVHVTRPVWAAPDGAGLGAFERQWQVETE